MLATFRRGPDLAVDLGSSAARLGARGRGIVAEIPTVVAVQQGRRGKQIVASGVEARKMLGRTPAATEVIRPVRAGVIVDFDAAEHLLRGLLGMAGRTVLRPRVVVCVPYGLTDVERKAVQESVRAAGARDVSLIDAPMAAAVGADLPVSKPVGSMIVDVGAGRTHVAVVSLGGVVVSRAIQVAGDAIDGAIAAWMRDEHELVIGAHTAESIKHKIGCAVPLEPPLHTRVRGRDLGGGGPREVDLDSNQLHAAISGPVQAIRDAMLAVLRETPPEISADILQRGVILSGGGGRLRHMDRVLRDACHLPVLTADDPARCVARGACQILEDDALYERVAVS